MTDLYPHYDEPLGWPLWHAWISQPCQQNVRENFEQQGRSVCCRCDSEKARWQLGCFAGWSHWGISGRALKRTEITFGSLVTDRMGIRGWQPFSPESYMPWLLTPSMAGPLICTNCLVYCISEIFNHKSHWLPCIGTYIRSSSYCLHKPMRQWLRWRLTQGGSPLSEIDSSKRWGRTREVGGAAISVKLSCSPNYQSSPVVPLWCKMMVE